MKPTVKYGSGQVMVRGCFTINGMGNLVIIDGNMDKNKYINILKENLHTSTDLLELGNNFIFYQDNDPKYKAYITR